MNDADKMVHRATRLVTGDGGRAVQKAPQNVQMPQNEARKMEIPASRLYKETPTDMMVRRKHIGEAAKALIARRALVGVTKLRESEELDINDVAPLPTGEYAIVPLSLLKNNDGTADLQICDVRQTVLFCADVTVGNTVTTVGVVPALSMLNVARSMTIQNKGANDVYVEFDGVYDPAKDTTVGDTAPASGVGAWVRPNGSLTIDHAVKANPRLISPAGNQDVNIVIQR